MSDNSPQLGGQDTDDTPMISSVQTRIIVSARGAYQARNLDALIAHLSEPQTAEFRRALIRQSIALLEPRLPPSDQTWGEYMGIHTARQWLDNPAAVDLKRAVAAAQMDILDGNVRYFDYSEVMHYPIFAIDAPDLAKAAQWVRYIAKGLGLVGGVDSAHQWQLDAAWALITDHPLPPIGENT